jgi:hypothetical protein
MGLSELLSNPQLIGMAMAGLSRDREAPMNAMKSLAMVEDINQKRAEQARVEQERVGNAKLLQALMQAQAQQGSSISDAFQSYGDFKTAPNQIQQPAIPNNQSGTGVDYETGQSYTPAQTGENPDKRRLYQAFMNKLSALHKIPSLDLSQFEGASAPMQLAAMKHHFETKPADKLMEMIDKQNKPIILPDGSSAYTQDPFTGELVQSIPGKQKKTLDAIKASIANGDIDPANLSPEVQQMLGMTSKEKSLQRVGILEKGGGTVSFKPDSGIEIVTGVDGTQTSYDPKIHGPIKKEIPPTNNNFYGLITENKLDDITATSIAKDMAEGRLSPSQFSSTLGGGAMGAFNKAIVVKALQKNFPGTDLAKLEQQYAGGKSGATRLGGQEALVGAFEKAATANLDMALKLSDTVDRTGSPVVNKWLLAGKKTIAGNPEVAAFDAAIRVGINEVAKITSSATGGQVTSDSARKEIEGMLNSAQTPQQIKAVISTLKQDMANRMMGYKQQKKEMGIGGNAPFPQPSQLPPLKY